MEPEISTKIFKKLSEKLRAKFPATTHGYSMVKFAHLDFLTASKPSRRLITAAKRKGKEKEEKKKNSKIDFCSCLSPNVVKRDASGKKGMPFGPD